MVVGSKDIVFLNFYADWCRFSQMLKPIFDKAADKLHSENVGSMMMLSLLFFFKAVAWLENQQEVALYSLPSPSPTLRPISIVLLTL